MAVPAETSDRVIVVGAGIAGLATALHLAPLPVTLIAQARLGVDTATAWAQGGLAAALGADDTPELHAADTLAAGTGLSEPSVALAVTRAAPACIEWLKRQGVSFDRDADGDVALGLEAAHARRRIVHAQGDGAGRIVLNALVRAVRALPSIAVVEDVRAVELMLDEGAVAGLLCARTDGLAATVLPTRRVALATGGLGGLYAHTTNPLGATGSGLALAARAGAVLRDLEFVQFHPTAIASGADPMPLATEAVRGEGAVLVNGRGERFMADIPGAELAPRDIVARAIFAELKAGQPVFLDARAALGQRFADRFPSVAALCRNTGLDPGRDLIPVRPAAHYHMGGVRVDRRGRASIEGLWACGEVASTGLHGANRLASNSLVEALAFARWIAEDILGKIGPRSTARAEVSMAGNIGGSAMRANGIRELMTRHVGVIRDASGLHKAVRLLARHVAAAPGSGSDPALVALLVATAAFARRESRGAHFRSDHPALGTVRHTEMTLASALTAAAALQDQNEPNSLRDVA
ncbi:MAG: L-aspartate oxidase [Rhodoplanes sp.]